ncbi:hypothetical protein MNEG_10421 [Monoraphidium neglectum]|uniref:Uncharacterized protein n=1 Tax=Monoraphidium neglectum TaxID=145388 RepID=A0A0D2M1L8_9CHLO|nr:hypothetical protein MNEG_10421 [Monoraphidium neglectum]KIY97544.1 hypothetical protein MNEG_10421 [Monoraphidium neglectum]|eukprot:XP_013896564.1 hypothetical protein MNEG_10421 [Monoraphidium neglectum]
MLRNATQRLLQHAAAAAQGQQQLQLQQQWGPAPASVVVRWFSEPTNSAKEAVERTLVVNTLDMAKKFESAGLSRQQAEALTEHITTQVILDRCRLSEKFVAKADLEKARSWSCEGSRP